MTLATLPGPIFSGADLSARLNAALLELRPARRFATVATLLADTTLAYGSGARAVAAGDALEVADGGHVYAVASPGAADHHLTTAGGVKLHVRPGPRGWNVRSFGATGTADDTPTFNLAKAAAVAAGGGTIYAPAGTYILHEFALTNGTTSAQSAVGLEGDYAGTVLRARDAGKFAVTLHQSSFSQPWWAPLLRNLQFWGNVGGTKRMGCGLYAPREFRLEHVTFHECLLGLVTGDAYYFGGRMVNFRDCFAGCLQGTFVTSTTIASLVNGAGATVSVTLPFAMNNGAGHAGNRGFEQVRVSSCDIGWAMLGETYSPHNLMPKLTAEGCQIALLVIRGSILLQAPWFESNATSGTISFNGTAYEKGSVVVGTVAGSTLYEGFGGHVRIQGGRTERLVARAGGLIEVDDWCQLYGAEAVYEAPGGRVVCDRVLGDSVAVPALVRRPGPVNINGNAIIHRATPKTDRTFGLRTRGKLLAAEDFQGAALTSTKVTFAVTTPVFNQVGGVFPGQKYASGTGTILGLNMPVSADYVAGSWYVHYLMLRATQALTFTFVNLSGYAVNPPAFTHPTGEWFAVGVVLRNALAANAGTPQLRMTAGASCTFDLGGWQVARFDNRLDAAEFMADPRFYMTEG